ncbi:pRL2-23 [Streptomyces sp. ID05-39B]|uniref:pRL2-23 n=1 Tax=Streptomyces sp. ID05-39B TaxID=3028664 RepID=UPI0029B4BD74|nr:pRL2-23 [Streptomyces sp. ID05-39B]MDX3524951.1 pRL2-23 [Streptomyces sp. ID05-39B]
MWTTVIAVLGTLLGAVVAGVIQHQTARAGRVQDRAETLRREQFDAIAALAACATEHRRVLHAQQDFQRPGHTTDQEYLASLKAERYATRSATTAQLVRVQLLILDPAMRQAAADLVTSTYNLRDLTDADDIEAHRLAAVAAHNTFVDTAAAYLNHS